MYGWQDFETVDYFACEGCCTAWETECQAEQCGRDCRQAARDDITCGFCFEEWDTAFLAVQCERGHIDNDGARYPSTV